MEQGNIPIEGGLADPKIEIAKIQVHLALLKEEYIKLQNYAHNLEYVLSTQVTCHQTHSNGFLSNLYKTVSNLHNSDMFSDMKVILVDKEVDVHKVVLESRSTHWGVSSLINTSSLDWRHIKKDVATALIKWIYTDQVDLSQPDAFTLDLMTEASKFQLAELVCRCERALMASASVENCILYYCTAEKVGAETLKKHCSTLISTYWDDFKSEDFKHMSAPSLYEMFKTETKFPLHCAVRLKREDVVFLYIVENNNKLADTLNTVDTKGELPLDLALKTRQNGIAAYLLENGANPDCRDSKGYTLLHNAVERGDGFAAKFLIENKASVTLLTPNDDTALHIIANFSSDTTPEESSTAMADVGKLLLEKGLDPNMRNKKGYSALHLAVMNRNEEVFSLLLTWPSVNLDLRTQLDHTALWFALIEPRWCTKTSDCLDYVIASQLYNSNSFAARLIEKGADPNPVRSSHGNTLMHDLINEDFEEPAIFLCSHAKNINHTNEMGETVLHLACLMDLGQLVTKLLECGADPNIQNKCEDEYDQQTKTVYSQTPLHIAIRRNNVCAVKAILAHKAVSGDAEDVTVANLNLRNSKGDTPLSLALIGGMDGFIPELIRGGADVNMRNGEGLTLLHQAIIVNKPQVAILLLENKVDIDARTADDENALELAIKHSLPEVVEALCHRGIDMSKVDSKNNCPLWTALESAQEDIASILVKNGVDTDCWSEGPDGCQQTLLHRAIDENKEQIAKFLISCGCDVNTPRRPGPGGRGGDEAHDEQTPLHLCCQWGLANVAQCLIQHYADVNAKDADGKTPLHVAIQNQQAGIINLLLWHPYLDLTIQDKKGLTPFAMALLVRNNSAAQAIRDKLPTAAEQFDSKGRNFLHTAIQKNDVVSVLFLLSIGVDVNSRVRDANQSTPLHLAAQMGNETLVRSLLLASARPNDRDCHRRTPLHVAAESGQESVISALLQNGADFDATDTEGDNALHVAVKEGHFLAARVLLTESQLNAEAVNLKGRNPLHTLARYAHDNAASICELFLECMPNYPLDKPDTEGNTALILAYTKGNGNLCRALVDAGACVGAMNKYGVTIFNYQVASNSKTLLKRLLDSLSKEPPWVDGDICLECGIKFGLTMRKHHCRHCGRLLCSKCSSQEVPIIKFNLNKPVRVCEVCFDVLHVGVS